MIDSVEIEYAGKTYPARLTLGVLEDVRIFNQEEGEPEEEGGEPSVKKVLVPFMPDQVFHSLALRLHTPGELRGVLGAILKGNGIPATVDEFLDEKGMNAAVQFMLDLFVASYGAMPKKDEAPPENPPPST